MARQKNALLKNTLTKSILKTNLVMLVNLESLAPRAGASKRILAPSLGNGIPQPVFLVECRKKQSSEKLDQPLDYNISEPALVRCAYNIHR